jgi:hypothetical protein
MKLFSAYKTLFYDSGNFWYFDDVDHGDFQQPEYDEYLSMYIQQFIAELNMRCPLYSKESLTLNSDNLSVTLDPDLIYIDRLEVSGKAVVKLSFDEFKSCSDSDSLSFSLWGSYLRFSRLLSSSEKSTIFAYCRMKRPIPVNDSDEIYLTSLEESILLDYAYLCGFRCRVAVCIGSLGAYIEFPLFCALDDSASIMMGDNLSSLKDLMSLENFLFTRLESYKISLLNLQQNAS